MTATPNAKGWTCDVRIDEQGDTVSEHTVTVLRADKERFAPDSTVEDLVSRSFEFLLERESPTSILRAFALTEIESYFADFPRLIRQR